MRENLAEDYAAPLGGWSPRVILDVGANVGAAATMLMDRWPGVETRCYEPEANNYRALKRATAPYPQASAHNVALWHKSGTFPLYRGINNSGEWSLYLGVEQGPDSTTINVIDAYDELYPHLSDSYLKLDTEGAELAILSRIAQDTDLATIGVIALEWHRAADRLVIDNQLSKLGFILYAGHISAPHRGVFCYGQRRVFGLGALDYIDREAAK